MIRADRRRPVGARGSSCPASRRRIRPALAAVAAAAMLGTAGCAGPSGTTGTDGTAAASGTSGTAGMNGARRLPVTGILGVRAVTGLPAVTRPLSAADVQKDSSRSGLAARLRMWGYLGGWQRTFQGESRRLTLVVSRSLTFRARSGAVAFVAYLTRHLGAFYPFALRSRLTLGGQAGWLIKPPSCACHMAEPLYVGVTAAGRQVRWLEINGPQATGKLLTSMLAGL